MNGTMREWEHDRMRFETLNEKQLVTRLGRITDKGKMERFVVLAEEMGYYGLAQSAQLKMKMTR